MRVFVSDLEATSTSRFADLLADAASVGDDGTRGPGETEDDEDPEVDDDDDEDDEGGDGGRGVAGRAPDDDAPTTAVAGPSWAGDASLLADMGVGPEELVDTSESNDPATALAVVGERMGFVDLLEALR